MPIEDEQEDQEVVIILNLSVDEFKVEDNCATTMISRHIDIGNKTNETADNNYVQKMDE